MHWVKALLRRFLLPALVGGYAANLGVYTMLGSEGAATDWRGVGTLAAIILAGLLLAWPGYVLLQRRGWPVIVKLIVLFALGTAIGALLAWIIALQIVPDTATAYIRFGLLVGPVATVLWLLLNFDVLRPRSAASTGD